MRARKKHFMKSHLLVPIVLLSFTGPCWAQDGPSQKLDKKNGKTVSQLIEMLKSKDSKTKIKGATGLRDKGKSAKSAIPALIEALNEKDYKVLESVRDALGAMGAEAIPPLTKVMRDTKSPLRSQAIRALGKVGPAAKNVVPELLTVLKKETDNGLRWASVWALGKLGSRDGAVINALIEASTDKAAGIRSVVVESLGALLVDLSDPKAVDALKRLSKDKNIIVRVRAENVIQKLTLAQNKSKKPITVQNIKERHSYKLSVNTSLQFRAQQQVIKVETPHVFYYDNCRADSGILIQLNEIHHNLIVNGAESIHMCLNKNGTITREKGHTKTEPYQKLDAGDKKLLDSLFRVPMATIYLSEKGEELSRSVSKESKYGEGFDATIHNVRWFHPEFSSEQSWGGIRVFDVGQNGKLEGYFSYKKTGKKDAKGHTLVAVTAVISKDKLSTNRGKLIKPFYKINGVQSYDEKRKIWVSGQTKVSFFYKLNGVNMAGSMTLTLSMVDSPAKLTPMSGTAKAKGPQIKLDLKTASKYSYKMSSHTDMTTNVNGQALNIATPVTLRYDNFMGKDAEVVQLKEFQYQVQSGGHTSFFVEMDKDHIGFHNGGKKQNVPFAKADQRNKALIHNLFNIPLARMSVDKEGKELRRTVNEGSVGGKAYNATVHNVRWFHARFGAKNTWEETRTFDLSKGGTISGKLTFRKLIEKDAQGNTVVQVNGVMTQAKTVTLRGEFKNIKAFFVGEQSYDEKRKIWVSGRTEVWLSYQLVTPQGIFDSLGKVTLKLNLEK